jgi:hypothetical protein
MGKLVPIILKVRIDNQLALWGGPNYPVCWYLAKKQALVATTCLNRINKTNSEGFSGKESYKHTVPDY